MAKRNRIEQKAFEGWLIQRAGDMIAVALIADLAALFTIYIHSQP